MRRYQYADPIDAFLEKDADTIVCALSSSHGFRVELTQLDAWREEIRLLQELLVPYAGAGSVYFEYSIPRLGRRIDIIVVLKAVIFVLEFKVGESEFTAAAVDQVCDYALDLKNFHEGSHHRTVAPILVATATEGATLDIGYTPHNDRLLRPFEAAPPNSVTCFGGFLEFGQGPSIAVEEWETSRYCPTPTIVEAAMALYRGHSVAEISRSDAGAINLSQTARAVSDIIARARSESHKAICFVTGVPAPARP